MDRSSQASIPRSVLWLILLSFVLQVATIGIARQYRTRAGEDHFAFGWEMGRIGRSIALGQGFSNPYGGDTGPSAWEPPLYPYLMGAVFKVFGIYSYASAWVLLTINCVFSVITCIPIYRIAGRVFDQRIALWSAWIWALLPYVWYWSVHWLWDTTISPFLLSVIFLTALELETRQGWRGWAIFGALWGIAGLANPSLLAFLPACGIWIWWRRHRRGLPSIGGVVLASAVFVLVLSPWLVRNHRVFGHFVFIRNDFGLQFRLGNSKDADGISLVNLQPNMNQLEFEKFKRMGELAYAADCRRIALDWIREDRWRFVAVSFKRFVYYWDGMPRPTDSRAPWDFRNSLFLASSVLALWGLVRAVRQKCPGAWLFALLVLTYPTTYYFVFPHARYRHPLEPELLILAVFLVSEAQGRRQRTSDPSRADIAHLQ
jgi:4-amino-4-deoxy-L-arabinose transferase-like glycosyltransferase